MEAAVNNKCHQGANVKRWREWRGLNQRALAGKPGIEPARLSVFEQKPILDEKFSEKVAKELNIPMEALTEMQDGAVVNIFSGTFTSSDSAMVGGTNSPVFNPIQKLVEVFEKMLDDRDKNITTLEEALKDKK